MPTAFVCLWHIIVYYYRIKKIPDKSHPIQPVKCSRYNNLVCCTLCPDTHTDSGKANHTRMEIVLSIFVSPRSLSNKIGNRNNNNIFL